MTSNHILTRESIYIGSHLLNLANKRQADLDWRDYLIASRSSMCLTLPPMADDFRTGPARPATEPFPFRHKPLSEIEPRCPGCGALYPGHWRRLPELCWKCRTQEPA